MYFKVMHFLRIIFPHIISKSFIYLSLIPFPTSSRPILLACSAVGTKIWVLQLKCGLPVCWSGLGGLGWDRLSSKFHTESEDEVDKGGQRKSVRLLFKTIPGLNETRIRVKCSICAAIKISSRVLGLAEPTLISHCQFELEPATRFPLSILLLFFFFRPLITPPPTLLSMQPNRHSGSGCGGGCP